MNELICLGKIKFDLRDTDEVFFAHKEFDALLGVKSTLIKTLAVLIKGKPFSLLDDNVIHLIARLPYLGEGHGIFAKLPICKLASMIKKATFLRELYVIFEVGSKQELKSTLVQIGLKVKEDDLDNDRCNINPYTVLFLKAIGNGKVIATVRFIPFHTLFEYAVEVKKLPAAVFRPKNSVELESYFNEKEQGIVRGLNELLEHMQKGEYRSPHFGLGKNHIGDFVDWASTDLRKPFLHYLHKYKGKGDPRISRALINLLKVSEGDTILDPFVGSGAFIADAPTMGINAVGIEILNIGKAIAEVKCNLKVSLIDLKKSIVKLFDSIDACEKNFTIDNLHELKAKMKSNGSAVCKNILPHLPKVLFIKNEIKKIYNTAIKNFLRIILSQQIVEFSEKKRAYDIMNTFKSYVEDRYLTLYATRKLGEYLDVNFRGAKVTLIKGDSTNMSTIISNNSIDGILTSPPYFDALDYIGNNKPSILILGFDDDLMWQSTKMFYEAKHRDEKEDTEEQLPLMVSDRYFSIELPESSINLIKLLEESRRSYKSKIVENYLKMMSLSFDECYRVLKKGKYYLMVISKYHKWVIHGKEEVIETSIILADIGKSAGFKLVDVIEHGLSKADKGKIGVEDILIFQK